MTEAEMVRELSRAIQDAAEVASQWLEPGVLTQGEAQDRLLEVLERPRVIAARAEAEAVLAEQVEEAFG